MTETQPKCDFCSHRPIMWTYPARDFTYHPTIQGFPTFRSRGPWAACARCHELIQAGNRRGLADRSARTHPQRKLVSIAILRTVSRGLHEAFQDARTGEPRPAWTP